MKGLAYIPLAAGLVALYGAWQNPYGIFGRGIGQLNPGVNGIDSLFQATSWIALVGGVIVFFYKSDKKQKILGGIAVGIPIVIFIYRYWFLVGCFLPGVSEGCL